MEYLAATSDLAGLQRLLGHADVRTTMRYVHIAGDELHERVERTFVSGPITWLPGSRWGQTGCSCPGIVLIDSAPAPVPSV